MIFSIQKGKWKQIEWRITEIANFINQAKLVNFVIFFCSQKFAGKLDFYQEPLTSVKIIFLPNLKKLPFYFLLYSNVLYIDSLTSKLERQMFDIKSVYN